MGAFVSSPSTTNPTSSEDPEPPAATSLTTMSSPNNEPETLEEGKDSEENSEEEGECGFCLFMKGGGCKEVFVEWENCVMEGEDKSVDIVEKCHDITFQLKKCMEAHADYYEPILKAEKAAEEEVTKEIEKQKEKEKPVEQSGGDNDKNK